MKINILGASGVGVSTLGEALAAETGVSFFDNDNFYWEPAAEPFSIKRDKDLRNDLLLNQLALHQSWILGGPMFSWGIADQLTFDLVVFLHLPQTIRMHRLHQREYQRYGDAIHNDPYRAKNHREFMDWAAGYDDDSAPTSRTISKQRNWLQSLSVPVLEISGDTTVKERVERVVTAMHNS
jgi:adenylate kinase family enzyme